MKREVDLYKAQDLTEEALNFLARTKALLVSAVKWGQMDGFFGGFVANAVKSDKLERAEEYLVEVVNLCGRLDYELHRGPDSVGGEKNFHWVTDGHFEKAIANWEDLKGMEDLLSRTDRLEIQLTELKKELEREISHEN